MGDVTYWQSSYGKALDDLAAQISKAESASGAERDALLVAAGGVVKRMQGIRRSYNLEIKLMRDATEKSSFQGDKADKDRQLEALQGRLSKAREQSDKKEELFEGRGADTAPARAMTADDKLDKADAIQDAVEAKYINMITHLEEAEEVGGAAAQTLQDQREQIGRITEDVIEMEGSLTRADALIRVFSKRLATDKFIQCFGCLNVTALVAIILYVVIKQVGLPGSNPSNTPPSPLPNTGA
jgi:SNARE protein